MIRTKPRSQFYDEWHTPPQIVKSLGQFDLDPCCSHLCRNRLAKKIYGPKENGLKKPWRGRVWLNPPFSNMRPFIDRMIKHDRGTLLIFAGSEARWQMDMLQAAGHVFMFHKNPHFGRPRKGLPSKIHQRVWLVPFGEQDVEALKNSGLPGLFFSLSP